MHDWFRKLVFFTIIAWFSKSDAVDDDGDEIQKKILQYPTM